MVRQLILSSLSCLAALSFDVQAEMLADYLSPGKTGITNSVTGADGIAASPEITMNNGALLEDGTWQSTYSFAQASGAYTGYFGLTPVEAFSFTVTRQDGYCASLQTLSFDLVHEGIQANAENTKTDAAALGKIDLPTMKFDLYAEIDGGARQLIETTAAEGVSPYYFSDSDSYPVSFDVSSLVPFNSIRFSVEYSFLNDNASDIDYNGTLTLSNVILTGDASIPEPSAAVLGLMGVAAVLWRRKR